MVSILSIFFGFYLGLESFFCRTSTRRASQLSAARSSSRMASSVLGAVLHHEHAQALRAHRLLWGLVEQEPVEPDVGDGAGERLEIHRFDDVAVCAQGIGPFDIRLLAGRRQYDNRNRFGA